jgi:predicted amidohydrolase YtcJ
MLGSVTARNMSLDSKWGAGRASVWPSTIVFALYSDNPMGAGVEISGGSYAAVTKNNDNTTWAAAVNGEKVCQVVIAYPMATAAWSANATWLAIRDPGGTLLEVGQLSDVVIVDQVGVQAKFEAGTVSVIEPIEISDL